MAPVLLLGGFVVAAGLQPAGFNSARDTISALAALDAHYRGVMTASFVGLGLAHVATAVLLAGARVVGRVLLGVGGLGTVLVAVFPERTDSAPAPWHFLAVTIAILALVLWPLGLVSRRAGAGRSYPPFPARMPVALGVSIALTGMVGWCGLELLVKGAHVGLSERLAALGESVWPLIVVLTARIAPGGNQ
jgi:hypothetical membrane protein